MNKKNKEMTIKDNFTKEEVVRVIRILISNDISHAIEFSEILKKEDRENSQIIGEMIRCLRLYDIKKAEKWLEKLYKN